MGGVLNGTLSHPFGTPWRVQVGEKNPMQQAKVFPNCSYFSWIQKTIHPSPTKKISLKKKNSPFSLGKINKNKYAFHPSIPELSPTQPTANLRGFVFQDPQAAFTARSWKHGPWIRWFSGLVLRDFEGGEKKTGIPPGFGDSTLDSPVLGNKSWTLFFKVIFSWNEW